MLDLFPQAFAATSAYRSTSSSDAAMSGVLSLIFLAWYVLWIVQAIMGYGTAYRKTKENGDNGVSLFGWMIVYCSLAALVPGLGIYLWNQSKKSSTPPVQQPMQYTQAQYPMNQYPPTQYPASQNNQNASNLPQYEDSDSRFYYN